MQINAKKAVKKFGKKLIGVQVLTEAIDEGGWSISSKEHEIEFINKG